MGLWRYPLSVILALKRDKQRINNPAEDHICWWAIQLVLFKRNGAKAKKFKFAKPLAMVEASPSKRGSHPKGLMTEKAQ